MRLIYQHTSNGFHWFEPETQEIADELEIMATVFDDFRQAVTDGGKQLKMQETWDCPKFYRAVWDIGFNLIRHHGQVKCIHASSIPVKFIPHEPPSVLVIVPRDDNPEYVRMKARPKPLDDEKQ